MSTILCLKRKELSRLVAHLTPWWHKVEQLAFLFVTPRQSPDAMRLICQEIWFCTRKDLAHQSAYNIALKDEAKAKLIKRGHDLGCALVEAHSHTGRVAAQFSPSDYAGFADFVPHVRWRLRGAPYAAIVMTKRDMDGFVWAGPGRSPERLQGIEVDGRLTKKMNGLSPLEWIPPADGKP
jgi:hypothetical protein